MSSDAGEDVVDAAYGLMEDKWIKIQENTFTNWVNQQLRDTDYEVENLGKELCDGVKLCALVATLQGRAGIKGMKPNPKNRHQKIENATLALQATKLDKVKLVNIGAEDIVNGNKKLILGLVWSYILRYQIGKTEIPPKQLMLAWLNAVIPSCNIKNFTTDWNNGKALHALIEYCEPGLAPDWKNLSTKEREANCEHAMRLAQERLGVPLVVSPQNMASSDIDQLSGMTYLSYFMKIDSCGYKATLREVNKLLPTSPVFNFTSDWRDGTVICSLVQSVGGHIPDRPHLESTDSLHSTTLGIQAAKELGIEPILSAADMVQPQAGHLAVMTYAARFINRPLIRQSAAKHLDIMFNTVNINPGSKTEYSLLMKHGDPRLHSIDVTVTDPVGHRVPTALEWQDNSNGKGIGSFTPTVTGAHMLKVQCDGEVIRGCPIAFNVTGSGKAISVIKREQGVFGEIAKLEIVCDNESSSNVHMICTSPSGQQKEVPLTRSQSGRFLRNSFVPDAVGDWKVSVICNGEHAAGSPFSMHVIKPPAVKLYNLEGGVIGEQFSFMVDTSEAGKAELQCVITHSGRVVTSTIKATGENKFNVKFVPTGPGVHLIRPMFGGKDVRDEPYKVEIADSNQAITEGQGLSLAKINQPARFTVDVGNAGTGDVTVHITDSSGGEVPCKIHQRSDRLYDAEYTPLVIGVHELVIKFADKQVRNSPFSVNVYNDPSADVPGEGIVDKPITIILNTADTGTGDLNIIVNGGQVPVQTKKLAKTKHSAEFLPTETGQYKVELEFNNTPIRGSPWYVNVTSAARSRSVTPPLPTYTPTPPPLLSNVSSNNSSVSEPPPPVEPLQPIYSQIIKKPKPAEVLEPLLSSTDRVVSSTDTVVTPTQTARVGEMRYFDASTTHVKVKIQDEFGAKIPFDTKKKNKHGMTVAYSFKHIGDHWIHLSEGKRTLKGSPYLVLVFDPNLVVVSGLKETGTLGEPSEFMVDATKAGKGEVSVKIDQGNIPCAVHSNGEGLYRVSYVSKLYGTRTIDVFFNTCHVKGSPFTCSYNEPIVEKAQPPTGTPTAAYVLPTPSVSAAYVVPPAAAAVPTTDLSAISVYGDGLDVVEEDKMAIFYIDHSGQQGHPDVRIEGRHSVARCDVQSIGGDKYKVSYIPVETGLYNIYVKWDGRDLDASPYHSKVVNSRKIRPDGNWSNTLDEEERLQLVVSQTRRLLFDVTRAGPGELNASGRHLSTQSPLQCTVSERDQYHYWVDITAGEPGDAVIELTWSGYAIPESPISALVTEPVMNGHPRRNRVLLTGDGYLEPMVNKVTDFYIDGTLAEKGEPQVTLKNSKLEALDVTLEPLSTEQEYRCSYQIDQSGTYMLHVSWNHHQIEGSPFTLIAKELPDSIASSESDGPDKIKVHGPGVLPGILANFEGTFYIDTEGAGKGGCEVKIKGPKGDVKYHSSLEGPNRRLIQCIYEPTEVGLYVVYVKWSGQDIADTPIKIYICDTYEELNRFKDGYQLRPFVAPQDDISLSSYNPPINRNAFRSKSVPQQSNGNLVIRPPIRSNTAGPRSNSTRQHNVNQGKLSYFVVEENSPAHVTGVRQQQSIFIANP